MCSHKVGSGPPVSWTTGTRWEEIWHSYNAFIGKTIEQNKLDIRMTEPESMMVIEYQVLGLQTMAL